MNFETLQLDSPEIPEACRDAYRAQIGAWPAPGERDPMAAVWAMAWLSKQDAATADDGWIEWHGGECPVHGRQKVCVQLRCEGTRDEDGAGPADCYDWSHVGSDGDIVAYRIVKEARHG